MGYDANKKDLFQTIGILGRGAFQINKKREEIIELNQINLNKLSKMRENSHNTTTSHHTHDTNIDTIASTHIPSPSAISSPSTIFHHNSSTLQLSKRHSKSKTATSVPFRNSIIHDPHKLLTAQASAVSTHVNTHQPLVSCKNYNPFSGYYGNSYKRSSNSSTTTHTMSIHEDEEHDIIAGCDNYAHGSDERECQPPLLRNNNSGGIKLKLTQSNTSPLPSMNNSLNNNNTHSELEGYAETNANSINTSFGLSHSHSSLPLHEINKNTYNMKGSGHNKMNSKYNLNISASPASLHPNNFSPEFALNNLNNNSSISDIDLDLNVNNVLYNHIQPVAMAASLFTNKPKDMNNRSKKKMNILINGSTVPDNGSDTSHTSNPTSLPIQQYHWMNLNLVYHMLLDIIKV